MMHAECITSEGEGVGDNYAVKRADERKKEVIFENSAPFTDYIS